MAETRIRRDLYAEVGGELPVIVRVETGDQVWDRTRAGCNISADHRLLTLNQPAWRVAGQLAARAGLIVERALTARRGEAADTYRAEFHKPNLPDPNPYQLWMKVQGDRSQPDDLEALNQRIKNSPRPQLATAHIPERPGLLVGRRSVGIGPLLERSLSMLRRFEEIQVLPSGTETTGRDKIFGEHVLVEANIDIFNASPVDAEKDLRTLLELETYPVNNSLKDSQV